MEMSQRRFECGYVIVNEDGKQVLKGRDGGWVIGIPDERHQVVVFQDIEEASRYCACMNRFCVGSFNIKTAYDGIVNKMPEIHFHALVTRTKDELDLFTEKHPAYNFVVYMRHKYNWEMRWDYSFELLLCEDSQSLSYVWKNDWNEGQQCVEYIGIAVLDIPINEAIGREDK